MSSLKLSRSITRRKVTRCMYKKYSCSRVPLNSYQYCEKHVLEAKNAPFKQCSYTYSQTGEKCPFAVTTFPKNHTQNGLCKEHTEEYEASRLKPKCRILPPLSTADTILYNLSHYVKHSPYYKKGDKLVGATADELLEQIEKNKNIVVNPFTDINPAEINAKTNETLNFSCDVDSDVEAATVDNVWDNGEQDSSDTESLDHELNDPLRHAGVFTEEEMALAIRNHAAKIQNLCIQQYRRLLYLLREKRSKYLAELKREKEIYGTLQKPRNMTIQEKKQFDHLKSLAKYKKIGIGPEALLFKKMLDRRKTITPGWCVRNKNYIKCVFAEGGVKCSLRVIPSTKYCKKHILNDHCQVLFQECGIQKNDHTCKEPVVPIPNVTCIFHYALPEAGSAISETSESDQQMKTENDAENAISDQKEASMDVTKKYSSEKEIDSIEALLKGYTPKNESGPYLNETNFVSAPVDESASISQTKNIADDIVLNMTDKLFEVIPENLQRTITNALNDMSHSVDGWLSPDLKE